MSYFDNYLDEELLRPNKKDIEKIQLAKQSAPNEFDLNDAMAGDIASKDTGTQKITVEGVDAKGNKTKTITEAAKDAAPIQAVNGDTVDAVDLVSGSNPLDGIQTLDNSLPLEQALKKAEEEWLLARQKGIPVEGLITKADSKQPVNTFTGFPLAKDEESANKFEEGLREAEIDMLPKEDQIDAIVDENSRISQLLLDDTASYMADKEEAVAAKVREKVNSPDIIREAANKARAINADGTIDQDWLDDYNRVANPSEFDTTGIKEDRMPIPLDQSKKITEKAKAEAAEKARKEAEALDNENPGMLDKVFGGITDWFSQEGNTEEGFWDGIGGWLEENPVWANTIASGVASYIETGNPYEAMGKSIKGAVTGMASKKKTEEAARTEDIELNKLYTGESIEKYRNSNKITDLVGRKGAPEVSGSPDQYKAVGGKTYPIWNKNGKAYTRINGMLLPASDVLLSGKDVKSATAENEAWNSIGDNSVKDVIEQIKTQPAEFRIPIPAKSMANRIQRGVNALRKAFPGIDPSDPNIGIAVDDWFKDNDARFREEGKDFKWDTNVEKYMMNNIIMGKSIDASLPSDAFEIGGNEDNRHDVNIEETGLAWAKINNFVASNKKDKYVTPAQGMQRGWELYKKDWKPGEEDESPNIEAARERGIPPFIYFLNTVDLN